MSDIELQALHERLSKLERENEELRALTYYSVTPTPLFSYDWVRRFTWSPFQSPEVQSICANLTEDERTQLINNAQLRGCELCVWVVRPVILLMISIFLTYSRPFPFLVFSVLLVWFICLHSIPRLRSMRKQVKELLCDTDFAKLQGYTPSNLKLESFPWLVTN